MQTSRLTGVAVAALCGAGIARADYLASGYPNAEITNGRRRMGSYFSADEYVATGIRLSFTQPVQVYGLSMIGSTSTFDVNDMNPDIDVHGATASMTREQAFAANPFIGNVLRIEDVQVSASQLFGTSFQGLPTYHIDLAFSPFVLQPGNYIFSVPVFRQLALWSYQESSIDLGTAIFADSSHQGQFFEWNTFSGWPTGTPALDLRWNVVPAPSGGLALAAAAFGVARRRRRSSL